MVAIYALKDSDGVIRYVGKANDPQTRLKGHFRDMNQRQTPLYRWMLESCEAGHRPVMTILEWCAEYEWQDREKHWIKTLRETGDILNVAPGGNAPFCSPELRVSLGIANAKARQSTPLKRRVWEINRDLGQLLKQGYVREAAKIKIRRAAKLRPDLFGRWAGI